ncbi:hypothetical protein KIW84_024967 [Lathyrus oleraceus]|uniref:Subtilisin-like protease n=1 Tax=Pisum sativum TaxID=3888 RepID=A0A9D5BA07_PEA|nr:hypothetical protein KIW84_024967 [Pisum sativum]
MENFMKLFAVSLFVILSVRDVSLARTENSENKKITYIVHVAKSVMPTSFNHHSIWYKSIVKSVSQSAEVLYTYDKAINGFSTSLTVEEHELLKSQPGILKVTPDKKYKLHTTRTPEFLGLNKIASLFPKTNKSSDVIVGVLDTGVWPESKSFDDTGYGPIPRNWKGKCETDQAIADNVNMLSLSLGAIATNYFKDNLAIGAFAAMEHGILVSCSAGNSGPRSLSVDNVAPWITTVGAGTLDRDFPTYVRLGNGKKYSGVSFYNGKSLPDTLVPFIYAGNASSVEGKGDGACLPGSLDPKKVAGKIVLCDRGNMESVEKGNIVKSVGGLGMVLANTEKNGERPMPDAHIFPATAVGFTDGEAIKKYLFSDPKPTGKIVFEGTKLEVKPSPVVADFSSRGPNLITPQILKPDLIAPGFNILAAYPNNLSPTSWTSDPRRVDFNILSGTSMSCPHVTGLAALIKSIHPDWSPAIIRSALMTTAYTTYKNNQTLLDLATNKPATPFDFGAGHVDPVSALNPGLVYDLTVDDYLSFLCALNYSAVNIEIVARRNYTCDPKKQYSVTNLNYPSFGVVFEGGNNEIKHSRTLTNVGEAGTYKVSVKSDVPSVKISVEPEVLSFKKNEKKSYIVTFTTSPSKQNITQSFGNLEWSDGRTVVRSSVAFTWKLK